MKIASSWRQLVLGIIALILIFFAAANIVTDRCSANMAALDELTWEELVDQNER